MKNKREKREENSKILRVFVMFKMSSNKNRSVKSLVLILNKLKMPNYQNEFLGLSRTEIQKEWDNVWTEIQKLDPIRDTEKLVELNKRFDKCVEAYYAVDCGDHWVVNSASRVKGYSTYKVMKES